MSNCPANPEQPECSLDCNTCPNEIPSSLHTAVFGIFITLIIMMIGAFLAYKGIAIDLATSSGPVETVGAVTVLLAPILFTVFIIYLIVTVLF